MIAQYQGVCPQCLGDITPGDVVTKWGARWLHWACARDRGAEISRQQEAVDPLHPRGTPGQKVSTWRRRKTRSSS